MCAFFPLNTVNAEEGSKDIFPHNAKKRKETHKPRLIFPLNALSLTECVTTFNVIIVA